MLSAMLAIGCATPAYADQPAKKISGNISAPPVATRAASTDNQIVNLRLNLPSHKQNTPGFDRTATMTAATHMAAPEYARGPKRALDADIDLRGFVVTAASWGFTNPYQYGFYKIPHSAPGDLELIAASEHMVHSGFDDGEGKFYSTYYISMVWETSFWMVVYDTETWALADVKMCQDYSLMATDVAMDPTTGDVYGCYYTPDGGAFVWGKGDYSALNSTSISPLDQHLWAVGCDKNGQYYAIARDNNLYQVEKNTGAMTLVAPVTGGFSTTYLVSGCINDRNNTFLVTSLTDAGAGLYEIDLTSGVSTLLTQFSDSEEVVGLHIAKSINQKVPAAPELEVTCNNGSTEAHVKLTMPATLYDGTPADGETMSYKVLADGIEIMSGSAEAAEVVEKDVTINNSGKVSFAATASNATGSSPKSKTSCFIGKGTPAAPSNVVLTLDADGKGSLVWDPVTAAADEGFFDPTAVTYTVSDKNGDIVKEKTADTSITIEIPVPDTYTRYSYKVQAEYDGKISTATSSNTVSLGMYAAPLVMDMTDADNFASHTVADANNDGKTWAFNTSALRTFYTASMFNRGDDWLFSPGIRMEGGHAYKVTADAASFGPTYPERIEIYAGTSASAEAMTQQVVAPTVINTKADKRLTGYIIVPETGTYHLGFHAISDPEQLNLYLSSYAISAPISGSLPAAVTEPSVIAQINGDLTATVSFKAPSTTIAGNDFTGEVKVTVLRGENQIKVITTTAGTTETFEDNVPALGEYTYTFISSTPEGEESISTSVTTYIGPKTPADIDEKTVTLEEPVPGTFNISWAPINSAADGSQILPSNISYKVYKVVKSGSQTSIGEEITTTSECSHTYVTDPIERQQLFYLAVQPFNREIGAAHTAMGKVLTGTPYELPVIYTGNASLDQYLSFAGKGTPAVGNYFDFEIHAQDGDDSFYAINNAMADFQTYLQTGKIHITGKSPVASLYVYCLTNSDGSGTPDRNQTTVSVICDGTETELNTFSHENFEEGTWNRVKFSLADFIGKTVMVRITATAKEYSYNIYDNIRIFNDIDHDLAAEISAPATVKTGQEFEIAVKIVNHGAKDAENYKVVLSRDGKTIEEKSVGTALGSDKEDTCIFRQTLNVNDAETVEYQASVILEGDENPTNDMTATVAVTRKLSTVPAVSGLHGETTPDGNSLSWDPVVIGEKQPRLVTEDFESAEPFAQEFSDWTFVDVDNEPVGGFNNMEFPGITPRVSKLAFFIFDNTGFNSTLKTLSGTKFLAALYRADDGQTDDWAISPLLTGEAQTISFFARSYNPFYPENIEVWYTTSDSVDPADYTKTESFGTKEVPSPSNNAFTEYTVDLPEGTTHFAIRSCASGSYLLMVEDITFKRLEGFDGELLGYNVYRNGTKITPEPVKDVAFTDNDPDREMCTYHVSAMYDKGESELSEPITLTLSGLDTNLSATMSVKVDGNDIVVTAADEKIVTVNAIDGRTIHIGKGNSRITVLPGIYLVTIGNQSVKVIVR